MYYLLRPELAPGFFILIHPDIREGAGNYPDFLPHSGKGLVGGIKAAFQVYQRAAVFGKLIINPLQDIFSQHDKLVRMVFRVIPI